MDKRTANWIDRCTMHLGRLRPEAGLDSCTTYAERLWPTLAAFEPEQAAEMALLEWFVRAP